MVEGVSERVGETEEVDDVVDGVGVGRERNQRSIRCHQLNLLRKIICVFILECIFYCCSTIVFYNRHYLRVSDSLGMALRLLRYYYYLS